MSKISLTIASSNPDKCEFTPVESKTILAIVVATLCLAEVGSADKRKELKGKHVTPEIEAAVEATIAEGATDVRSIAFKTYRSIEATHFTIADDVQDGEKVKVETAHDAANWPKVRQIAALNGRFRTAAKETGLLSGEQLDTVFPSWAATAKKVVRRA